MTVDYKHQIDMLYKLSGITAKTGHTQIAEFFTAVGRSIQKLLDENEQLRNEREMMKIQYNGEELTVKELCTRWKLAECRAITAEHDKASLLQDKRSTDLYIRDKNSGRIHRVGDECHDALWVDVDGTVHYSNLQNGDGCADYSQIDPNAGYEFMPSDFGELVV